MVTYTDPCPDSLSGVSAQLFVTLINTLMASKCQIGSLENYPVNYSPQNNQEFDFIVVGSGSAGAVVANKLSENSNWTVLVLEAGTYPSSTSDIPGLLFSLQGTSEDWQYTAEPSHGCSGFKDGRCKWPRGKCLGGSSCMNGMLYVRGNERDYDTWAQTNPGWDYDTVLPYFHEIEDLQAKHLENSTNYGRGGPLPLSHCPVDHPIKETLKESARLLGVPTALEETHFGYFESLLTVENGVRASTGKVFLTKRPNLHVVVNATVTRLVLEGKKVTGVEATTTNRVVLKARKEVIVSAGAINSPQLLMLSGIGPREHLQSLHIESIEDLAVGANLQDHTIFMGFYATIADEALLPGQGSTDKLYRYFMHREGTLANFGITNLMGFFNTRNDSIYPNMQLHHYLYGKNDDYFLAETARVMGFTDKMAERQAEFNKKLPTFRIVPTLLNPKSRGHILLRSNNSQDKPLIYANYFSDSDDLEVMLEGIKFAHKQLKTAGFQKYEPKLVDLDLEGCKGYIFGDDDYWRCALKQVTTTVFHPVGTCKMGPKDDAGAVVDARLRVHGIEGLRVIDASIMPTIVSANTHAASMLIGRKGATMIMEDWKQ